jgi:branched-chain amino acid transport system ATP-binding protein
MGNEKAVLEVNDIHVYYGQIHALKGVTLEVHQGEIVTLIGSNGAGKSTLLNTLSGILKNRKGKIFFNGRKIDQLTPHEIVTAGILQVPEENIIFERLSVTENLEMGAFLRRDNKGINRDIQLNFDLFPRLRERRKQIAGTLSGGEQKMLAIARALMARPRLLLLDEPSMGLAPILVALIFEKIGEINQEGTSILLVEQNALLALQIAQRGYVIQTGKIVLKDKTTNLLKNDMVRKTYLGIEIES